MIDTRLLDSVAQDLIRTVLLPSGVVGPELAGRFDAVEYKNTRTRAID